MATIIYGNDLTDITLAEATTGFTAIGSPSGLSASPDIAVQGTNCVDKQITGANKGMLYDNGSTITMGADDHVFAWIIGSTPGLEDTLALEGKVVAIGTTIANYIVFHVSGSDVSIPGLRTEVCYPIRYVTTTSGSAPYRTLYGSTPGANPQWFGGKLNTTATVKGANLGVDAVRYGTGYYLTEGTIPAPGNFEGVAADNDAVSARRGIFSAVPGGFSMQGRMVFGQNTSGTPTLCIFNQTIGATITLTDTPHSLTDFTQFIFDHADTLCFWRNIAVKALGTHNPGQFRVINDGVAMNLTDCSFTDIGILEIRATCVFRRVSIINCDQITVRTGQLADCTFDNYTGAADTAALVWTDNLDTDGKLDGTSFTASGAILSHAIEFGTSSALTLGLVDVTFTDYSASNGVNDSMLLFADRGSDVTWTVNVSGGTTPSYKKARAGDTVNIINAVTISDTVRDVDDNGLVDGARVFWTRPRTRRTACRSVTRSTSLVPTSTCTTTR